MDSDNKICMMDNIEDKTVNYTHHMTLYEYNILFNQQMNPHIIITNEVNNNNDVPNDENIIITNDENDVENNDN